MRGSANGNARLQQTGLRVARAIAFPCRERVMAAFVEAANSNAIAALLEAADSMNEQGVDV